MAAGVAQMSHTAIDAENANRNSEILVIEVILFESKSYCLHGMGFRVNVPVAKLVGNSLSEDTLTVDDVRAGVAAAAKDSPDDGFITVAYCRRD